MKRLSVWRKVVISWAREEIRRRVTHWSYAWYRDDPDAVDECIVAEALRAAMSSVTKGLKAEEI
jgi:hypothetical protein